MSYLTELRRLAVFLVEMGPDEIDEPGLTATELAQEVVGLVDQVLHLRRGIELLGFDLAELDAEVEQDDQSAADREVIPPPTDEFLDEIRNVIRGSRGAPGRIQRMVDDMNANLEDRPDLAEKTVEDLYELLTDTLIDARHYGDWDMLAEAYPVARELARRAGHHQAAIQHFRDYDATATGLFLTYAANPTPENEEAAERAITYLEQRYDHLLRRIDGNGDLPAFPVHAHNAADHPADCAAAALYELAGAELEDRAETLAHGLTAVRELERRSANRSEEDTDHP